MDEMWREESNVIDIEAYKFLRYQRQGKSRLAHAWLDKLSATSQAQDTSDVSYWMDEMSKVVTNINAGQPQSPIFIGMDFASSKSTIHCSMKTYEDFKKIMEEGIELAAIPSPQGLLKLFPGLSYKYCRHLERHHE